MKSIVSVHDVMPHTMANIEDILEKLPVNSIKNVYLLVVPGLNWLPDQLLQLRQWQNQGYKLAGHGWTHKITKKISVYHHLHSFFISRDVAEHLSLTSEEVYKLVSDNYQWFIDHDFKAPELYVPPAWALGKLSHQQLNELPFRFFEVSSGIYDSQKGTMKILPLTGYEADRNWRTPILKFWNHLNVWMARKDRSLRISIHPYDLTYPLERDIYSHISRSDLLVDCEVAAKL